MTNKRWASANFIFLIVILLICVGGIARRFCSNTKTYSHLDNNMNYEQTNYKPQEIHKSFSSQLDRFDASLFACSTFKFESIIVHIHFGSLTCWYLHFACNLYASQMWIRFNILASWKGNESKCVVINKEEKNNKCTKDTLWAISLQCQLLPSKFFRGHKECKCADHSVVTRKKKNNLAHFCFLLVWLLLYRRQITVAGFGFHVTYDVYMEMASTNMVSVKLKCVFVNNIIHR